MRVKIVMLKADPKELRGKGDVRPRGNPNTLHSNITSRIGFAEPFELATGRYTYVFTIPIKGSFELVAVNAANDSQISAPTPYQTKSTGAELRYFFEVP